MPVISTNTAANTALRYLNTNSTAQSESLAKLSSGSRIVSAKDDASGLAIATSMNADITVLNQAATNVTSGTSVLNTADGALSNIADILQRMKSLTAQAQSGSSSTDDLSYINAEYTQLSSEIDDIASTTNFNGVALLSSSGTSVAVTLGTAASAGTLDTDYFKVATGNTSLGAVSYLADGTATTVEVGDYVDDDGAAAAERRRHGQGHRRRPAGGLCQHHHLDRHGRHGNQRLYQRYGRRLPGRHQQQRHDQRQAGRVGHRLAGHFGHVDHQRRLGGHGDGRDRYGDHPGVGVAGQCRRDPVALRVPRRRDLHVAGEPAVGEVGDLGRRYRVGADQLHQRLDPHLAPPSPLSARPTR
jgi:flagellin